MNKYVSVFHETVYLGLTSVVMDGAPSTGNQSRENQNESSNGVRVPIDA